MKSPLVLTALEDWVCRSRIGGTRRRHTLPLQIVLLHASMCGGEAEARSSAERHHHYLCLLTTKRGPQKRLFRCGLSSDYLWEFNTKNRFRIGQQVISVFYLTFCQTRQLTKVHTFCGPRPKKSLKLWTIVTYVYVVAPAYSSYVYVVLRMYTGKN